MKQKKHLLLTCFFLFSTYLMAQRPDIARCSTDEVTERVQLEFPRLVHQAAEMEYAYEQHINNQALSRADESGCEVYIIPTVIHVIYNDEASNISDEQILSQVEVLNQDYRKVTGSPGDGNGVDMKIQFCLAQKDPDGNTTTGITRTESGFSMHSSSDDSELKELIRWDPERYLNIWIVKEISSGSNTTLGYTYIPGTVPRARDGVVITSKYIGTTGTATSPYNKGRTLTHEIGHFLGLHHTFRSEGACSDTSASNCLITGDRVCDTPAEEEAKYFCPEETNSCIEFPCDRPDPIKNYLNYVDDVCMSDFTQGQRERTAFFLDTYRNKLVSAENLEFTGCTNTAIRKTVPEVKFSSQAASTCAGSTVQFSDESIGCVDQWSWQFPGGSPASSSDPSPTISYASPGWYDVTLRVSNDSASSEISKSQYIFVPEATSDGSFANNFEMGTIIPTGWQVVDEDGKGSWLLTTLGASDGLGAALMRNYQLNSQCSSDDLISSTLDLSKTDEAMLTFDYAYQLRTADPVPGDRLIVELSTNCGRDYSVVLFDKSGGGLATVFGVSPDEAFIPKGPQDWKTASINLRSYAGRKNIRIRFRNEGKGGQQLYLDRITLSATVGLENDLRNSLNIYPNPFQNQLSLSLRLLQSYELNLSILDMQGKQITPSLERRFAVGNHTLNLQELQADQLPAGIYLLRIKGQGTTVYEKLVKY